MGHTRTGRLPKTLPWRRVVALLDQAPEDTPAIARATAVAAAARLQQLGRDPSLTHCFWLLTRIAEGAKGPDFAEAMAELGLDVQLSPSVLAFIAQVNDHARVELNQHPESGPFGELASLALRRALSETVGQEGRSLFGSTTDDLAQAFRRHAGPAQFGTLARRFFGDFLARTLRFFVDKELANQTGSGHGLQTLHAAQAFGDALDLHARQTARIVEQFGADWYSKHHWESGGAITHKEVEGFVAHALQKLQDELAEPVVTP